MLIIWGETEGEIQDFLELTKNEIKFDKAYIGKKGVGNNYLNGKYYIYDLLAHAATDVVIEAPARITALVQWCSPDIILSEDEKPLLSIETTYHTLTYNNIAQRIPRQIKSAKEGNENVIFQKIETGNLNDLVYWFVKTFEKATEIYKTSSMVLLATEDNFESKRQTLIDLCKSAIKKDVQFTKICKEILDDMNKIAQSYTETSILMNKRGGKFRKWLKIDDNDAYVYIGVKPEGAGWETKGTGLMDPYPGLVKMVEILFCYNNNGKKIRRLTTVFTELPRNFWWFEKHPDEIYYKMIKEFSDEVKYKEESRMIQVTQSLVINKIAELLKRFGYRILYKDLPGTSRSGFGERAKINLIFEHIFDKSPDIVAFKNGVLLVIEVDNNFSNEYKEKFDIYRNLSSTLISEIQNDLHLKINKLEFGFGYIKNAPKTEEQSLITMNFSYFILDENNTVIPYNLN